jgi:hypothetical protein
VRGSSESVTVSRQLPHTLPFGQSSENGARTAGQALTLGAALTSTWTGVRIAGLNIADYLLVAAVVIVLIDAALNRRRLPIYAWAVLPPATLLLLALAGSVTRGDPLTAQQSKRVSQVGDALAAEYGGALPLVARLILSLTAVAIIVAGASDTHSPASIQVKRLMATWAIGAAVSGAYAVIAFSSIGRNLNLASLPFLTYTSSATRPSGLANHPNSLGQTVALALPLLIYMASESRRFWKLPLHLLTLGSIYGLYLSGSRAALLMGTVLILATLTYLLASTKRVHAGTLTLLMFAPALAIVAIPDIIEGTRFFDDSEYVQISNAGRVASLRGAVDIFLENPIFGAGVGSWRVESVPLDVLTSGGLLYAAVFYGSLAYPLLTRPRGLEGRFVPVLVITALGVFCYGFLNNGIVERYQYWPFAALFALSLAYGSKALPPQTIEPPRSARVTDSSPA